MRGFLRHWRRIAVGVVLVALAIGLYNDFAIRWRVEDSFAGKLPPRTQLTGCHRLTSHGLQSGNLFECGTRRDGRAGLTYWVDIQGRCWQAIANSETPRIKGCLSPFAPSSIGGA